ncbi:TPA: hypothetical protein ACF4FK_000165 [Streptococcus pyogenes]|uniref:Phage protein n=1 Tax=Streptococcus dysgalactiae TaxID=1334 RepID=A0ABU0A652_STRDY|nr:MULTISPECIES: hypothetical protein [Streptococcus]QBX14940.1 hypothetical protein Javan161_0049 [Streptococcus phage Javan161]QBX23956.1 hypothetical protein Javan170_0015 [Streptococcus phage Javan170]ANC23624.1 phage hypothetical protein [Streptococcus pyogenes]ESU91847.1 hypothetical protein HMPREF1244_1393 [Streptococcus pyogenes GA19702]MDQ0262764.1 hypothetical protein [Streptococcus dysgalactiae]
MDKTIKFDLSAIGDGGKWRLDAINNIANYLKEELADQTNITILA